MKEEPHKRPSPKGAFFAAPVDQRPVVYGVVPCPTHVHYRDTQQACGDNVADGASNIDISFVNGEFISLNDWERTDCGVHPDMSGKWSVEKLGDPARKPLTYADIEGPGANGEYDRRAARALLEQNSDLEDRGQDVPFGQGDTSDDKEIQKNFPTWRTMSDVEKVAAMEEIDVGCLPEHDDKEWYIKRSQGRWNASGIVWTDRVCGYYVDFQLPLHASFAVPPAEPIALDDLKTRIKIPGLRDLKTIQGLKDRFWSPDRQLLVVIVNTDKACVDNAVDPCTAHDSDQDDLDQTSVLQIYSPHGQNLGEPIVSLPLKEFESPVMDEWATGTNVARWTTDLKKIATQKAVTPLLSSSLHP